MSGSARFERKAHVEDLCFAEVRRLVRTHPAGFRPIHAPRHVNNVYLDDADLGHYRANVEGLEARQKVRIRWYGPMLGRVEGARLEFKRKHNLVGTKESHPLPAFSLEPPFDAGVITAVLAAAALPQARALELRGLQPSLLNRYRREYWLSRCGRFRLTLDRDLEYYRLRPFANRLLARNVDRDGVVVEIKYDVSLDDEVDRLTAAFPFFVNKISKYCRGIESFL
jgi:hypothetical protein